MNLMNSCTLRNFPIVSKACTLLAAIGMAFMCTVAPSHAHEFSVGNLSIDHPWARATAPAARTGVVYFSIKNAASKSDTLLGITVATAVARRASLHEMSLGAKGVMRMVEIKSGLAVGAKSTVKFAPGGHHVMLEGLVKPLLIKQKFGMTLQFAKAGAVAVVVQVE